MMTSKWLEETPIAQIMLGTPARIIGSGLSSLRNGSSAKPSASRVSAPRSVLSPAIALFAETHIRAADSVAVLEHRDPLLRLMQSPFASRNSCSASGLMFSWLAQRRPTFPLHFDRDIDKLFLSK
jgi:hypothetical protein